MFLDPLRSLSESTTTLGGGKLLDKIINSDEILIDYFDPWMSNQLNKYGRTCLSPIFSQPQSLATVRKARRSLN